jgi:hypothetical protein
MRYIFTDGENSVLHVVFGIIAVWLWWITPLFLTYQFIDYNDKNLFIDLAEFVAGYAIGLTCKKLLSKKIWTPIY